MDGMQHKKPLFCLQVVVGAHIEVCCAQARRFVSNLFFNCDKMTNISCNDGVMGCQAREIGWHFRNQRPTQPPETGLAAGASSHQGEKLLARGLAVPEST